MHLWIAGCPSDNESCLYTAAAAALDRSSRVREHDTIGNYPLTPPHRSGDTGWECAVGLVISCCCDATPPLHAARRRTLSIDDMTQVAAVASLASSITTAHLLGEGNERACTAR
uniref:Uncharacterized protein n=1 Tax=Oryza meridionalis TaxID=40149 RepID=A0A0E0ED33_9ORYZ